MAIRRGRPAVKSLTIPISLTMPGIDVEVSIQALHSRHMCLAYNYKLVQPREGTGHVCFPAGDRQASWCSTWGGIALCIHLTQNLLSNYSGIIT